MGLLDRLRRPSLPPPPFPVEGQLAELAGLGIRLAPGVTLEQVLAPEGTRGWVEQQRFGLLSELDVDDEDSPVRTVPGVARIHLEGAEDDDSYPHIARVLARAARRQDDLAAVTSQLDHEAGECRVDYQVSGRARSVLPDVNGDWIDGMAVGSMAEDLTADGLDCAWWIGDGDAWCTWLPPQQAEALMRLVADQTE